MSVERRTTPPRPPSKVAIILAYRGHGYQGMQNNPGAKTIESDLEHALFRSAAVPDPSTSPTPRLRRRYDFSRAARTDKGVSALFQVVSGNFILSDELELAKDLNCHLPEQIRVLGVKRTMTDFDAKKGCEGRTYVYLLPVFALDRRVHCDRESVVGSVGGLGRCLECSERGRKVFGVVGRRVKNGERRRLEGGNGVGELGLGMRQERCELGQASDLQNGISQNGIVGKKSCETGETYGVPVVLELEKLEIVEGKFELGGEATVERNRTSLLGCGNVEQIPDKSSKFQYGEKEKERFNRILKHYVGVHNFHNLTTRIKAEDPSAWRHILSIDASTVVVIDGIEFVKCEIVGQSFMLHQIRKMIGLAVAVVRNCTSEALVDLALRQDVKINVPTAPDVGLYLEECFFTSYNAKCNGSHEELSMASFAEQAEDFKLKHIYPYIASMEKQEGAVALWLHSLNRRNYPDFQLAEVNKACNG